MAKGGQLWKEYMRGVGGNADPSEKNPSSRKSSSVEPTVTSKGRQAWEKFKAEGGLDRGFSTSVVDDFVRDSQAYMQRSGQRLQGMDWAGSRNQARDWSRDTGNLQRRYHEARAFLRDNADRFDPDRLRSIQSYLDQFGKDFDQMQEGYRGVRDFYGQFEDQAAYDDYVRRSKLWLNQKNHLEDARAQLAVKESADGLTEKERKKKLRELDGQISGIQQQMAAMGRAGDTAAGKSAIAAAQERLKDLRQQRRTLELGGEHSGYDELNRQIQDSREQVSQAMIPFNGAMIPFNGVEARGLAGADNGAMERYAQAVQDYQNAGKKLKAQEQEKARLDMVKKYDGKTHEDNFWGQFGANYSLGRLSQDSSLAWNKYLNGSGEENQGDPQIAEEKRRYAETIDQLITQHAGDNEAVLADDGTLPWISKTLANYLPQFFDQAKYSAAGAALGLMTGNPTAVKAGVTAGSGLYSYETMRGAAFKGLLEAGVDEDTARAAANDEAVISSLIEMGDTALDLATLGGGKVIDLLTGGGKQVFEQAAKKGVLSKLASALEKYGLNVLGEGVQEGMQEAVSIANTERDGSGKWDLVKESANVLWDAARGENEDNRQQILEAGKEGMKLAAMMGAAEGGYNAFVSRYLGKGVQEQQTQEPGQQELETATEEQNPPDEVQPVPEEKTQQTAQELVEQEAEPVQAQNVPEEMQADGTVSKTESIGQRIEEPVAKATDGQRVAAAAEEAVEPEYGTNKVVQETKAAAKAEAEAVHISEGGSTAQDGSQLKSEQSKGVQAVQVSTGEPVSIQRIESTDGKGGMSYRLENGEVAQAKDIQVENAGDAILYEAVAELGVSASTANTLVDTWKKAPEGVSAEAYTAGMLEAFNYGRYHIPMEEMGQSKAIQPLTDMQKNTAYAQGAAFGGELVQSREANARRARMIQKAQAAAKQSAETVVASNREGAKEAGRKGRVVFDRKGRTLTEVQEAGIKTMELLSEAVGTEFHVFESYEKEGKRLYRDENGVERAAPNGWYDPSNGRIYIDLNAGDTGAGTMLFTVAHELTHFIRQWSPAKFDALAEAVIKLVYEEKGISVVKLVRNQQAKAERNGRSIDFDTAYEEVVADSMESILTSGRVAEMMAQIQQEDQSLWQKIRQWFQKLAADIRKAVQAYAGYKPDSAEGRAVAQMEQMLPVLEGFYTDALNEAGENYRAAEGQKNTTGDGGKKFSIGRTTTNKPFVIVDRDILEGVPPSDWVKTVTRNIREKFPNGVTVGRNDIVFNQKTRRELTNSEYTHNLKKHNPQLHSDKLRATDNLDEIVHATTGWVNEGLNHERADHIESFARGTVLIRIGDRDYSADVLVGTKENGQMLLYDILKIQNTSIPDKKTDASVTSKSRNSSTDRHLASVEDTNSPDWRTDSVASAAAYATGQMENVPEESIPNHKKNVNKKLSARQQKVDADGNMLSAEQVEYFRDSKVRDEDGKLLVMYHGTPNGDFTVFRDGSYFSSDKAYAAGYQNPNASMLRPNKPASNPKTFAVYLNIQKLFDLSDPEARKIYIDEYIKGGNAVGINPYLPDSEYEKIQTIDWTEGEDLRDFLQDNEYDYDGLVLDEGGTGGYGETVKSRGVSYVIFRPEQVKNVDNTKPTENPDIRYSQRTEGYTQEDLESIQKELQRVSAEKRTADEKYDQLLHTPELMAVEKRMEDIRNGAESRFAAIRSPEYKQARAERNEIRDKLKLDEAKNFAYDLYENERRLQKELHEAEEYLKATQGREVEERAIAASGLSEEDYFRSKAVEQFGTTEEFVFAGYLLPDGKMLDFSGSDKKQERTRGMDHREIQSIYAHTSQTKALLRFLNEGNIRIMAETPGIDLSQKHQPTRQQYTQIKRFVREYADKRQFMVDITGEDGQIVGTYTYEGKVNADRVVNDIQYYFQNGELREQSAVAAFLYSDRDPLQKKTLEELEKENAALQEDLKQLKEWNKLQKQVTGGNMLKPRSVEAAARYLKKLFQVGGDAKELAQKLNGVYEYILNDPESTWEGVQEAAAPAIQWLHENEKVRKSQYAQDILSELKGRSFRLDEAQLQEVQRLYGSLKEYRRFVKNMASKKADMSLDSLWQEMASQYPDVFDTEMNAADMPEALAEILERLENMEDLESAMEQRVKDQAMLREIYDSYWRVSVLETTADKHKKEIDAIRQRNKEKVAELRQKQDAALGQLREEKRSAVTEARNITTDKYKAEIDEIRGQHEKRMKELRQKRDAALEELRKEKKAAVEGVRDTRNKADMRKKIRRKIMELQKLLLRGNKKQNVKEGMQDFAATALAYAEILFTDNYSEYDMIRNGVLVEVDSKESHLIEEANRLLKKRDDLFNPHLMLRENDGKPLSPEEEYLNRMERVAAVDKEIHKIKGQLKSVFDRERNRLNKETLSGILGNLSKGYWELTGSDAVYIRESFDENVYQHLLQLQKDVDGTTVRDMSLSQLKELSDAYTMVLTTVRNANKLFNKNLNMTRDQTAGQVIQEIRSSGKQHSKARLPGQQNAEGFSWNNEKPVYAFERLGSKTMMAQYQAIRDGQDTYADDMQEARQFRLEQAEKYHQKDWDSEKLHEFHLESGDVKLNVEQMMSIYALSRRKEGLAHLMGGGFVFGRDAKRVINKAGVPVIYFVEDATAYRLTVEEINKIAGTLTKEQRAFADAMQKYLADVMGSKGNEVSMELYGVKSFNDEHYFPIRSSGQYMERAKLQAMQKAQGQINLVNSGFTKSTVPNAKNPLTLDGFSDVWADHVQEMSMYHSMALPLEDFRRVYNYAPSVQEGQDAISVNAVIENAYGKAATGYIDQLYKDLNADVMVDNRETLGKKLVGKFKAAAVMASASVVIQQFSALPRAFALIDPKYFIGRKLDKKKHGALWAELKKYAPVAFIKEMGYFDTGVGMSGKQYLLQAEYDGLREKTAAIFKDGDYRDELLGRLPALADEITWLNIWEAVKRETHAKNPKLDVRSDDFLKLAGKRFSEIIDKTQVYDSVLSRSANMRSKAWYMNVITSFMAEPTTTINMVEDAIRKGNKKQIARTLGSVLLSQTMNALLVSLVYAARDDDEDETWLEKYLSTVAVEMLEGLNPMGYYPLLKDVWSLMQGYDVERPDMTLVSEMVKSVNRLTDAQEKLSKAETEEQQESAQKAMQDAMWGIADAIASLMGMPLKNIRRDVKGAVSLARTVMADASQRDTTALSLQDAVWNEVVNTIPFFGSRYYKDKRDKLYGAMVADDKEYARRLESGYASESTFHGAVRSALREHDSRIWEAAVAWNDGDLEKYLEITKRIRDEKHFEQDDIVLAIRAEAESMQEKEAAGESKAVGIFNAEKLGVALEQDNGEMVKIISKDLMDTDMANGKTEEEAKDALESDVRRELKGRYLEGSLSRNLAVRQLARHGGMTQEEAKAKVEGWDWFKANPDSEATEADVTGYLKQLPDLGRSMKDYGLSMDTYRKEKRAIGAFESDKDGEGNSIAYSRINKAFPYIRDLPLSAEQKTALAVACGWSLKTVEKNKLW